MKLHNKPIPKKFLTWDRVELGERMEELKKLTFYRLAYNKRDKKYLNMLAILDIYIMLDKYAHADQFTKDVLEELLFI